MTDETRTRSTLLTVAVIVTAVAILGVFAAIATGPAAANHGSDAGDYTVVLPEPSDHLPGDQNEANASMRNFASAGPRFEQEGAPNGFETLDYIETGTPEIDYSECGSSNTAAFGIDRGNNNSGTQTDTDLLEHMKESRFKENKIEVEFYEESDFGGDPTHLNPEDAIVSVQGAGSAEGPCFTMPTEPGWYQVTGLNRGTTEDGEVVEIQSNSHYFPICEGCHDEDTAEEELGPPPSQRDGSQDDDSTPTPTATPDEGDTDDETATTDESTPTPAPDDAGDDGTDDAGGDDDADDTDAEGQDAGDDGTDDAGDDAAADGQDDGETTADGDDEATGADDTGSSAAPGEGTPTPGDGPGFTGLAAVIALLATSLIAHRRH